MAGLHPTKKYGTLILYRLKYPFGRVPDGFDFEYDSNSSEIASANGNFLHDDRVTG